MKPSENDFVEDNPLAAESERAAHEDNGGWRQQARDKATLAKERTQYFVRENPVPTIVGALVVGVAIGWALRYAVAEDEEEEIAPARLSNLNWSALSLPFLWPFLKSVKEKYEDSAETVKDGVDRLRDIDLKRYAKPLRKRWKAWTD
jgi:hypothetical protein